MKNKKYGYSFEVNELLWERNKEIEQLKKDNYKLGYNLDISEAYLSQCELRRKQEEDELKKLRTLVNKLGDKINEQNDIIKQSVGMI